jgi:2,3,4,5-tetrahydropyridine-2-carboxylate N-succinyltransferase
MNPETLFASLQPYLNLSVDELRAPNVNQAAKAALSDFLLALEQGHIRTASRDANGTWHVEPRVKQGILLGFRLGDMVSMGDVALPFVDKDTFPVQQFGVERKVRIVPGGSSVRRGAYVAPTVTMMPPAFINVGSYVDEGTMVDSHALVGSCAQIGKRVHLSAAAQIGGVLEPIGAMPVIIEDDVFVGGNTGIYEGTIVRSRAVIAAGVILTASVQVYDLPNQRILSAAKGSPLEIPEGAVLVPGSRPAKGEFAVSNGLSVATPIIVKYRDDKTDGKAALEGALRS